MIKKAFTLIELLVVVAIVGLLASVVIVSVSGSRKKAQDAKVKNDIQSVLTAAELHLASASGGKFDTPAQKPEKKDFCIGVNCDVGNTIVRSFKDELGNPVMQQAPQHPTDSYSWQTDSTFTKYVVCGVLSNSFQFVGQNGATFETASAVCPTP